MKIYEWIGKDGNPIDINHNKQSQEELLKEYKYFCVKETKIFYTFVNKYISYLKKQQDEK